VLRSFSMRAKGVALPANDGTLTDRAESSVQGTIYET
jgi:hypothetical protein